MIFESKYEVGQKLFEIKQECDYAGEKCERCGHLVFTDRRWIVDETEQEIHGINMRDGAICYKVWRPCVYREMLPESDIGRIFFPSIEQAKAEAERLNAEKEATQ